MRYYIADCHFYHDNLNTEMDFRGFADGHAMNAHMLAQWNARVRKRDEVIILGDLCLGTPEETKELL
ncbi:MAG: phosphoesterase, partial [Lachnospiraceae bacterium]|nr:phosphoesterase [Lachnospiraceae bacterium]